MIYEFNYQNMYWSTCYLLKRWWAGLTPQTDVLEREYSTYSALVSTLYKCLQQLQKLGQTGTEWSQAMGHHRTAPIHKTVTVMMTYLSE